MVELVVRWGSLKVVARVVPVAPAAMAALAGNPEPRQTSSLPRAAMEVMVALAVREACKKNWQKARWLEKAATAVQVAKCLHLQQVAISTSKLLCSRPLGWAVREVWVQAPVMVAMAEPAAKAVQVAAWEITTTRSLPMALAVTAGPHKPAAPLRAKDRSRPAVMVAPGESAD
jgi:hypothetical protein